MLQCLCLPAAPLGAASIAGPSMHLVLIVWLLVTVALVRVGRKDP